AIGTSAGSGRNKSAGLNHAIKRAAINDQVSYDRERPRAPRLDSQKLAIPEVPHVQLTGRRSPKRAVRHSVDHHSARSADSLAAIVIERNRIFAALNQAFVDDVEHLEKR